MISIPTARTSFRLSAALLLIVTLGAGSARAQLSGLEISAASAGPTEAVPGKPATVSLVVTNIGPVPATVADHVESLAGIRTVFDASPYMLRPGERVARLVTVMVPRFLEAGTYDLVFSLRTPEGLRSRDVTTSVVIPAKPDFAVIETAGTPLVRAGEVFTTTFRLENKGNTALHINLSADVSGGLKGRLSDDTVLLRPGSHREVAVTVQIPQNWSHGKKVTVDLATSLLENGERRTHSALAETDVLTRRKPAFAYHRYPLSVSATAGTMQSGPDWAESYTRTVVRGAGPLTEGDGPTLGLDIRTPAGTLRQSSLAQRDRYQLDLRDKSYGLMLGDLSAPISPLAGGSVFGFGWLGRVDTRFVEVDLYRAKNRLSFLDRTEAGGGILLKPIPAVGIGVRATDRTDDFAPGQALIFSASFLPVPGITVGGEYGSGTSPISDEARHAFSLRGNANMAGVRVRADFFEAEEQFPSSRSNQSAGSGMASAKLGASWTMDGNYFYNRFGGFGGIRGQPGPTFYSHIGGFDVGYEGLTRIRIRTGYELMGRLTVGNGLSEEAWQHLGFVDASWQAGPIFAAVRPSAGVAIAGDGVQHLVFGGSLQAGGSVLGNRLGVSTSLRHFEGPFGAFQPESGGARTSSGSVAISVLPGRPLSLTARLSANYQKNGSYQAFSTFGQGGIEYRMPWGHLLSLAGVYSNYVSRVGSRGTTFYEAAFSYVVPLQLPIHKSRKTGLVSGRLVDGATGQGLADAAVFLGQSGTLTGADGRFHIPFIPPGDQSVRVESMAATRNYVLREQPELQIRGGRTHQATLIAVPAAQIEGMVRVSGERSEANLPEIAPRTASGIVVHLTGEGVERVAYTDPRGGFRFQGLPNGQYSLQVDPTSIGDLLVEDGRVEVTLRSGETRSVQFALRERRSVIQFQELESASARVSQPVPSPVQPQPQSTTRNARPAPPRTQTTTPPVRRTTESYFTHVVTKGDTLRNLSRAYFNGVPDYWDAIYQANKAQIPNPDVLLVGTTLRIPELSRRPRT